MVEIFEEGESMSVGELIELLKTFDKNKLVWHRYEDLLTKPEVNQVADPKYEDRFGDVELT